ncbi:hypothetical protein JCM33374_g3242 [Metschnikowia sp. JCM 33374]|nr:hypothetical protein JCM33374_g3242 [Metschnikowia sp. JCM 33374]
MKLVKPLLLLGFLTASTLSTMETSSTKADHWIKRQPNEYSGDTKDMAMTTHNENATQLVDDALEMIIEWLMTFISWEKFDTLEFSSAVDDIQVEIDLIESILSTYTEMKIKLFSKLQYTQDIFRMMVDADVLMEFYDTDERLEQILIYKTVQLNVQLLLLHDSVGQPNVSFPSTRENTLHGRDSVFPKAQMCGH